MIRRNWWVPVFYALAVAWIYRGLWHHHGQATGLGWDTIDSYGPDLDYFARELRAGRFSLWNPYDKGGYPVFCDPQIDRYYPFNWPFAAWGAVFGSSWWLVQIKVLAHHVAAATCMHAFLRSRRLSLRSAMTGGLGLVACAPMLTHKASIILWPLVWVPLVWIAVDFAVGARQPGPDGSVTRGAQPSWRRGVAVAAALTLPCTASSPPGLFYALMLIAPYAVWRTVPYVRERRDLRALAICAGAAAGVIALVLALAILPSRELVALGSRDRFATGRDFALALSLPEWPAARGVFVRGAGLFEMYMGAAVVLLAACALVVRPRFDRGAAIVWACVAAAGVVLAGGATTPVLPFLVAHVPGFAILRVPGRYKLVSAWAIAAGAGYGVAALEAAWAEPALRRRVYACAAVAVAFAIAMVVAYGAPAGPKDRAAWWSIVAAAGAAGLAVAAVRAPRPWAEGALAALAMFALFDAPAFTFVEPGAPVAAEPRQLHDHDDEIVARMPGVRDRWRVHDEYVLGERAGARLGIRDFRGYPAIDPLSLHRYTDVLDFARHHDAAIVTDFNVRWVLSRPHFRYGYDSRYVPVPNRAFEPRGGDLWEAKHPAPLVAWYGAVTIANDHVLEAVRAAEDPDGVRRHAVVEPADAASLPPLEHPVADTREGALVRYEPDAIDVAIDAPAPGLVVLNEIMFPGWRVTVDGRDATPVRANYLLRAVWVDAGHHTIAWRFSPAGWPSLVIGYALALAIMLAAAAWPRRPPAAAR
ncbi:MAG: hypothetical protein ACM31C_06975 [Acidobacteriota bacterium]